MITLPIDPRSGEAALVALVAAEAAERCVSCGAEVVGCAVHETEHGRASSFYPVCERHKAWEFAKLAMDAGDSIYL